ncbi:MAG: hypothetical protein NVSMB60_25800 [Mycobacterium sp.]
MAPLTYASALAQYNIPSLLASLLSGQNPDGTPTASVQRVNAGFMATGQTAKQYVGKVATSTTLTTTVAIETVTAGKNFYITDLVMNTDSASGATTTLDVRLQAAGVDIFRAGIHNLAPLDLAGIETQPFATSGQAVTLLLPITAGGIVNVWFNILGFEQ